MKKFDVTALGEILIDFTFYGNAPSGMKLFEQNPGGAVANVLSAVSNLGGKSAFIGKVGADMHGEFLIETLKSQGIDASGVLVEKNAFTTLAFVSLNESGERSFSFARKPGADTLISADEIPYDIIENSKVFHIGSLSLTDEPAKSATFEALKAAKDAGCIISYDPNYRAMLWENEDAAIKGMRSVLEYADFIKISDEETLLVTGKEKPEDAAAVLLEKGIDVVCVTLGSEGAQIFNKEGSVKIASVPCEVVDTTGAGDSFTGGFLSRMTKDNKTPGELTLKEIEEYGNFASKVAAFCIGKRGGLCSMPKLSDIDAV